MVILGILAALVVAAVVIGAISGSKLTVEQQEQLKYGSYNLQMVCPHCNGVGDVRTKPVTQKKGVSGGKATAAILTAGVSMLATGLSRKESNTQAHCFNCNNSWIF